MDKINWSNTTVGDNNLITFQELSEIAEFANSNQLSGYIVLKDTGADLTSSQLNQLKGWFGDTVFTKNSSGLIVDHKREYIQINFGGNIIVSPQGDVTLVEGNAMTLNATRFTLAEDDSTEYGWAIGTPNTDEQLIRYNGLTVIQSSESGDGLAYISSTQS
jgi:hypothetical protein